MNRLNINKQQDAAAARLLLMRAELEMAQGNLDDAVQVLKLAATAAEHSRSERLWALNWMLLCGYLHGDFEKTLERGRETLQYMDQYSSDQLAYLLFIVVLLLLRLGKADMAREALGRARRCPGWWGTVAAHVADRTNSSALASQTNPNLATESLFMAGELHLRLGNGELAVEHFKLCDEHPSRRVMTRQLARDRLREIVRKTAQIEVPRPQGSST
jgi:tetratricopeptide (TPR) repeat protein